MTYFAKLFLTTLFAFFVLGCKSSTTEANLPTFTIQGVPQAGNSERWHIKNTYTDTIREIEYDTTWKVTSHEQHFAGRDSVVLFNNTHAFIYEANGDLSILLRSYQEPTLKPQWLLPFSGGGWDTIFWSDDNESVRHMTTCFFYGSGVVTIGNQLFDTRHARFFEILDGNVITFNYEYQPDLQILVRTAEDEWTNAFTGERHPYVYSYVTAFDLGRR